MFKMSTAIKEIAHVSLGSTPCSLITSSSSPKEEPAMGLMSELDLKDAIQNSLRIVKLLTDVILYKKLSTLFLQNTTRDLFIF